MSGVGIVSIRLCALTYPSLYRSNRGNKSLLWQYYLMKQIISISRTMRPPVHGAWQWAYNCPWYKVLLPCKWYLPCPHHLVTLPCHGNKSRVSGLVSSLKPRAEIKFRLNWRHARYSNYPWLLSISEKPHVTQRERTRTATKARLMGLSPWICASYNSMSDKDCFSCQALFALPAYPKKATNVRSNNLSRPRKS